MEHKPEIARIPVTIVSGFLGAGKTTLLAHVLTSMHGRRVAVIENEFADEMGIESLILKDGLAGRAADGFYELQNGCLCCTTKGDLAATLEKIIARSREQRFDLVLIETSGLASPGPVAAAFWSDVGDVGAQLELDGVVTVVDASNALRQLGMEGGSGVSSGVSSRVSSCTGGGGSGGGGGGGGACSADKAFVVEHGRAAPGRREAEQQIGCADVILLNKVDLAGADDRARLRRRLNAMNSAASVVECERSCVALDLIMGLRAYDVTRLGELEKNAGFALSAPRSECGDAQSGHAHSHGTAHAVGCEHDLSIGTVVLRCDAPLSPRRVLRWMGALLWRDEGVGDAFAGVDVLRGKGVLCVAANEDEECGWGDGRSEPPPGTAKAASSPRRFILQSVHEQLDLQPAHGDGALWADSEERASKLILIGRGVSGSAAVALQLGFEKCAA